MNKNNLDYASYFIPGAKTQDFQKRLEVKYRELNWKTPIIHQGQLKIILSILKKNQATYLKKLSIETLLEKLDQVAIRWLNPKDPIRQKALEVLPQTTGCSREIISEGLNLAFKEVRARLLKVCLKQLVEFPQPKLSSFIFAGIIPTPMLFDVFLGLLLRSAILAKSPSREPFFPILLAKSISKVDPRLGSCIAALWWPGGQWGLEKTIFKESDVIHAYGDDETVQKIKSYVPSGKTFLPFAHKVSFSIIGKEKLLREKSTTLAERVAYDISLYDQQGCVSPHVIYLEESQKTRTIEWIEKLARAMGKISQQLPPARLTLGEASKIHQTRGQFQFRKKGLCLSSHPKTDWTVIYEENPQFRLSCLNRVIFVKTIKKIEDLTKILRKKTDSFQALGYAASLAQIGQLEKVAQKLHIPFVLPIGKMQATSFKMHIEERLNLLKKAKHLDA